MTSYPDQFYSFINNHLNADPRTLLLTAHGKEYPFPVDFAITQIEARRKSGAKLAPFTASERFLFPTLLSAEQASDWRVACFHASLLEDKRVLDLTAGLGIDAITIAGEALRVTAVEIDEGKCETLRHNCEVMGKAVEVLHDSAENVIERVGDNEYDAIFIDPARRSADGKKVHAFTDCSPDVISLMPRMLEIAPEILIKSSPMLDVRAVLRIFPRTSDIYVVSLNGEVKEVLVRVKGSAIGSTPTAHCVMIKGDEVRSLLVPLGNSRSSGPDSEKYAAADAPAPGKWLYEPDAALMKLGPWQTLQSLYPGLRKIARDTHLFISDEELPGFPGRGVRIKDVIDKKSSRALKGTTANVAVRNYPLGAEVLRKKLGVKDGGDTFIYAFRNSDAKPVMLLCERPGL